MLQTGCNIEHEVDVCVIKEEDGEMQMTSVNSSEENLLKFDERCRLTVSNEEEKSEQESNLKSEELFVADVSIHIVLSRRNFGVSLV